LTIDARHQPVMAIIKVGIVPGGGPAPQVQQVTVRSASAAYAIRFRAPRLARD
jgi:hypothetical protein